MCIAENTEACNDCMVSYLVGHEPGMKVVLDRSEQRFADLLADVGLVPASQFRPRPTVA